MKKLIFRKQLLETPIFTVSDNQLIDPEGHNIRRIMVEHNGSAVVMPVDERERVLLVKQYRYPARDYLWELPAGGIPKGETALQGAKRELLEETGYVAKRWKKLTTFYPSPGFQEEWMTIFLARELRQTGETALEEEEHVVPKWFELAEVERHIASGKIRDAKTIIGTYLYQRFHR